MQDLVNEATACVRISGRPNFFWGFLLDFKVSESSDKLPEGRNTHPFFFWARARCFSICQNLCSSVNDQNQMKDVERPFSCFSCLLCTLTSSGTSPGLHHIKRHGLRFDLVDTLSRASSASCRLLQLLLFSFLQLASSESASSELSAAVAVYRVCSYYFASLVVFCDILLVGIKTYMASTTLFTQHSCTSFKSSILYFPFLRSFVILCFSIRSGYF